MRLAIVDWRGHRFEAEEIRRLDSRTLLMRAVGHGPRFTVGTELLVKDTEIKEWVERAAPADTKPDGGGQDAMVAE